MEAIFGSYLVGLTLVVLLLMRADALRDRCQLVSTRNFFLLGLLLFQTVSGALTLLTLQTERGAWMGDYRFAGFAFCLILTTFLALFLAIYRSSHWVERMAWRRARGQPMTVPMLAGQPRASLDARPPSCNASRRQGASASTTTAGCASAPSMSAVAALRAMPRAARPYGVGCVGGCDGGGDAPSSVGRPTMR